MVPRANGRYSDMPSLLSYAGDSIDFSDAVIMECLEFIFICHCDAPIF